MRPPVALFLEPLENRTVPSTLIDMGPSVSLRVEGPLQEVGATPVMVEPSTATVLESRVAIVDNQFQPRLDGSPPVHPQPGPEVRVEWPTSLQSGGQGKVSELPPVREVGPVSVSGHPTSAEFHQIEVAATLRSSLASSVDLSGHHHHDLTLHPADKGVSFPVSAVANGYLERFGKMQEMSGALLVPPGSFPGYVRSPSDTPGLMEGTAELALSARPSEDVLLDAWVDGVPAPQAELVPLGDGDLSIIAAYLVGAPGSLDPAQSVPVSGMETGLTDFIVGFQEPGRDPWAADRGQANAAAEDTRSAEIPGEQRLAAETVPVDDVAQSWATRPVLEDRAAKPRPPAVFPFETPGIPLVEQGQESQENPPPGPGDAGDGGE
jgi:hypothetical protein